MAEKATKPVKEMGLVAGLKYLYYISDPYIMTAMIAETKPEEAPTLRIKPTRLETAVILGIPATCVLGTILVALTRF